MSKKNKAKTAKSAPSNSADKLTTVPLENAAPRWLLDLRRSEFRRGWYRSDETFAAQYTFRSKDTLIVSFDNLSNVNDTSLARDTWGYGFYASEGWSHMGVMAFERNWFRDDAFFDFMESQKSLFGRFKNVIMTGTSMGAYAATAFADLVPGCTVLAYSPQATLDKKKVPWEKRFSAGRKQDWSGRYNFGPNGCEAADKVYVIYDPYFEPDRIHAEMYTGKNVVHLKTWYSAHKSAQFMKRADILKPVVLEAVNGDLTAESFYKMFRTRRDLMWYYMGLADHVIDKKHAGLANMLADNLIKNGRPVIGKKVRERAEDL